MERAIVRCISNDDWSVLKEEELASLNLFIMGTEHQGCEMHNRLREMLDLPPVQPKPRATWADFW